MVPFSLSVIKVAYKPSACEVTPVRIDPSRMGLFYQTSPEARVFNGSQKRNSDYFLTRLRTITSTLLRHCPRKALPDLNCYARSNGAALVRFRKNNSPECLTLHFFSGSPARSFSNATNSSFSAPTGSPSRSSGKPIQHSFQQLPRNHFPLAKFGNLSRFANLRNLQPTNKNGNN